MTTKKQIALALSGGGVRAMVFHIGVFKYLAERQALERISHISSVSGGSLLLGLILQDAKMKWPSSDNFLAQSFPAIRQREYAEQNSSTL
ncbi:patatin-like phospholipase family protein [Pseudomonas sp. F1_0610]|uniref:patatin-like phospholipase family protein n=1 Tax=Pseudomonas sp. F1_0610 TaxID=3114284 RepID=UPI0039C4781E